MAKAQPSSQIMYVYKFGPSKNDYHLHHEITPQGGLFFRLQPGFSASPHAYNLAPGHQYAVIRVDAGIHSTLTVHKIRIASEVKSERAGKKKKEEDPPIFSECCCGLGFAPEENCPLGSTMDCSTPGITKCIAFTKKKKNKK